MNTNNYINKKLSTGIDGLDAIFHGGIHTHNSEESHKGIVILARGQHGVNKIHLSMQICEGLHDSAMSRKEKWSDVIEIIIYAFLYKNMSFGNIFRARLKEIIVDHLKYQTDDAKRYWEERMNDIDKDDKYNAWINNSKSRILINITKAIISSYDLSSVVCEDESDGKCFSKCIGSIFDIINTSELSEERITRYLTTRFLERVFDETINRLPTLFVSINKDSDLLKNSYYDFYIQRLIRNIKIDIDSERASKSLLLLHSMLWTRVDTEKNIKNILENYEFPSITGKKPSVDNVDRGIERFKEDIKTGFIYYNGRTHGLHIRHQKGAVDTGGMLLCKLEIPDDYKVRIIGKDTLNKGVESADGLTTFQKMMRELDKYNNKSNETKDKDNRPEVDFIMIDGLSRLNEKELSQCPLNALSDKLRSKSQVAIITADKKLSPSEISTDIVLDMEILQSERPDHQYTALKVSKCLYQKNAYGWHRYKMRNAGIEVVPSIHLQMGQRFLMDDIVTDAVLPINEYPYPLWLNENDNNNPFVDNGIDKARSTYKNSKNYKLKQDVQFRSRLVKSDGVKDFYNDVLSKYSKANHVLFVNLDKNRIDFFNEYIRTLVEDMNKGYDPHKIHLFNFLPGYIHTDEMLWALDQQILAIENIARRNINKTDWGLDTHYTHVNLVLGDLNYIHYAYPCLSAESLLLPALATYTKKHHMTNYVYATVNDCKDDKDILFNDQGILFNVEDTELHKKEIETIMQMCRIAVPFE